MSLKRMGKSTISLSTSVSVYILCRQLIYIAFSKQMLENTSRVHFYCKTRLHNTKLFLSKIISQSLISTATTIKIVLKGNMKSQSVRYRSERSPLKHISFQSDKKIPRFASASKTLFFNPLYNLFSNVTWW